MKKTEIWYVTQGLTLGTTPVLQIVPDFNGKPSSVPIYIGSVPLKFRPRRRGSHRGETMRYDAFTEDDIRRVRMMGAAPELVAVLKRMLEESPFVSDAESCECGRGDGRDEQGNICEHIQAHRALAKARGELP